MVGAQLGLETVVSAIFDGSGDYTKTDQETKFQIHRTFEGLTCQHLCWIYCLFYSPVNFFLLLVDKAYFSSFFP
jgi:hypothetical protein